MSLAIAGHYQQYLLQILHSVCSNILKPLVAMEQQSTLVKNFPLELLCDDLCRSFLGADIFLNYQTDYVQF